ncbi:YciI family protein [Marinococcus sp. PL1-022]|uniref:YciI family protein n=1 Tax=Marinococcus sp. PL1-022 TaxID=3095363 RepID=UPI0029C30706|nr:YciI family protein [Marinococcus sp. PL1-022]MDX6152157.1 YciI family protein [Marinococcus sp. PL1-022]
MKIFAVLLTMKDEEKSQKYRPQHLKFLEDEELNGNVLAYGRFVDGAGGLIMYRGEEEEAVREIVEQDPYIQLGARDYHMHEWDMKSHVWTKGE